MICCYIYEDAQGRKLTIADNSVDQAEGQSRNAGTELHLEEYALRKLVE
jgi:hypothetical protein